MAKSSAAAVTTPEMAKLHFEESASDHAPCANNKREDKSTFFCLIIFIVFREIPQIFWYYKLKFTVVEEFFSRCLSLYDLCIKIGGTPKHGDL